MTPQAALIELLGRVGAEQGVAVLVSDDELSQWPNAAVAAMKSQGLLAKARPACSAICPGCERECVMPVHTLPNTTRDPEAFIVCDKRSDINRVPVPAERLEQWHTTYDMIADVLARLLGFSQSASTAADSNQWHIGVLKGKKHKSRVTLLADDSIKLSLAGHTVPLAEVLAIEEQAFTLDKGELIRLVDKPADNAAGDVETPEQRRERLKARVREERAKGTKAFLQRVAKEEGISVSRLKQLVANEPALQNGWSGLVAGVRGASSKKIKTKY